MLRQSYNVDFGCISSYEVRYVTEVNIVTAGSCNLVQEISFHIVKSSLIFGTLRLFMMTTNLSLLM